MKELDVIGDIAGLFNSNNPFHFIFKSNEKTIVIGYITKELHGNINFPNNSISLHYKK